LSDGHLGSWLHGYGSEHPITRRFNFHYRFISFNFQQWLSPGYGLTFLLKPGHKLPGLLRHLKSGHHNPYSHSSLPRRATQKPFMILKEFDCQLLNCSALPQQLPGAANRLLARRARTEF
jgi:hypothetical protein